MPTATLPKSWFDQAAEGNPFGSMLVQAAYATGVWNGYAQAREEHEAEKNHTCKTYMDPKCPSCQRFMRQYVERYHLEMPLLLLGWDVMVDHLKAYIRRRTERRDAYLQQGAFI